MGKSAVKTTPDLKMMKGTGGQNDYLCVARKGNMAFGVKPLAAMPGAKYNLPGTTYFIVRVRVAPTAGLFEENEGNVVKLQQKFAKPADAWPNIQWQKSDGGRASTILLMFVKGTLGSGPELETLLLDNVSDKKVGKKLADQIVSIVGEENLIVKFRQLVDFTDEIFMTEITEAIEGLNKQKEAQTLLFAALEDNFGVEGSVLKGIYAKLGKDDHVHDGDDDEAGEEAPGEHGDPDEI